MKAAFLIGRAILGGFFVYNGIHHFQQTDMIAGFAKSKGLPMPKAAVLGTGAALLVGGASLITGIKPKVGVAAAVGFLATVSPTMHDFWNAQDPQQKMNDQINFMKNMALAGATLALAGIKEPWPLSVPIGQPSQFDRVREFGRPAQKFGREKYGEAEKSSRNAKKSSRKWFAA